MQWGKATLPCRLAHQRQVSFRPNASIYNSCKHINVKKRYK
jgi:hypothetical protein